MAIFNGFDAVIVGLYFVISIGIAAYYTKKAGESTESFFLGGRNLPWWLAGTSMVASSFATDTPLAVSEIVAGNGIAGNWLWWSAGFGTLFTVFFYARLWRRSGVMTDVELVALRYGTGQKGKILRMFKSVFEGVFFTCVTMGWVSLAMVTVLQIVFPGMTKALAIFWTLLIMAIAAVSSAASGVDGSVVTDFFQFGLAMGCCIILAILAVNSQGNMRTLVDSFEGTTMLQFGPTIGGAPTGGPGPVCSMTVDGMKTYYGQNYFPEVNVTGKPFQEASHYPAAIKDGFYVDATATDAVVFTPVVFFARVAVQWWAVWKTGGSAAQRMLSCKSEKDAVYSLLWYNIAHFTVRSWPWIIVALVAVNKYPGLVDSREGFVRIFVEVLPNGMLGVLVAAFIAAFMSTIDTLLGVGSSYLLNDLYRPTIRPGATEKHYVLVARLITIGLCGVGICAMLMMETITGGWDFLFSSYAGLGVVLLLRWYWWRINGWMELTAHFVPLFLLCVNKIVTGPIGVCKHDYPALLRFPESLYLSTLLTVIATFTVGYFTPPDDEAVLDAFFCKVRPPGPGWAPFRAKHPEIVIETRMSDMFAGWAAACIMVYTSLFFVGSIFLLKPVAAIIYLIVGGIATGFLLWHLPRMLAKDNEQGAFGEGAPSDNKEMKDVIDSADATPEDVELEEKPEKN